MWLLLFIAVGVAAEGSRSVLDFNHFSKADFDAIRAQIEAEKATVQPLVPPQAAAKAKARTLPLKLRVPPPPPVDEAPAGDAAPVAARPRRVRAVVMRAGVPLVAVAGAVAWRAWREWQLAGERRGAWAELQAASGSPAADKTPAPSAGTRARREELESLRRRRTLIAALLPHYAALELKPPEDLW
jgi:hypothetical protein